MLCFHRCFYSESHNLILGLESLFPSEFLKQTRSISSMRIANVSNGVQGATSGIKKQVV